MKLPYIPKLLPDLEDKLTRQFTIFWEEIARVVNANENTVAGIQTTTSFVGSTVISDNSLVYLEYLD